MIETFKNFFAAFSDFSFKSFFAEKLPQGVGDELSLAIIILVVFGLVECLFGWQLLRFEMAIAAFSAPMLLYAIAGKMDILKDFLAKEQIQGIDTWMLQFIFVVLGLMLAAFTWYHLNLAFFLGVMFITDIGIYALLSGAMNNTVVAAVISTVLSIPIAFILRQILTPIVIAVSSLGGALVVAFSLSGLLHSVIPSIGLMILTDLTVTGLILQVRRLLKSKVNGFMRSTLNSTNSFLRRYEGDVTSISRNFFERIGF